MSLVKCRATFNAQKSEQGYKGQNSTAMIIHYDIQFFSLELALLQFYNKTVNSPVGKYEYEQATN